MFFSRIIEANVIIDLGSQPSAYVVVDETLYVATCKDVVVIENGEVVKSISGNSSWFAAYPNSIVVANSVLYMGLRHGMFAIDLNSGELYRYFIAQSLPNCASHILKGSALGDGMDWIMRKIPFVLATSVL